MESNDAYQKNIRKYQIYVAVSGFTAAGPLCYLFYLAQGISFSQLSLIETVSLAVLVFFEVPSGAFADLIGRKKSMALGCLLMAGEFFLIGSGYTVSVFVLAALIGGIGISLESGADDALLYDSLKKLKREGEFQKILGQSTALFKITAACAGVLGGYLYSLDQAMIFYVFGTLYLTLAFYSLTMKETVSVTSSAKSNQNSRTLAKQFKQLMLRSYCCLKANKEIAWMIVLMGLFTTTIRAHTTILRAPMLDELLPNAAFLGVVVAIGLLLSSLVSWYAHHLFGTFGERNILFVFAMIASVAFIGFGLFDGLWTIIFVFIIYMLTAVKTIFLSDYWHKHFRSRQRGTLISFKEACQNFIGVFTLIAAGVLTDQVGLGISSITIGCFILTTSSLLFLTCYLRTLRMPNMAPTQPSSV